MKSTSSGVKVQWALLWVAGVLLLLYIVLLSGCHLLPVAPTVQAPSPALPPGQPTTATAPPALGQPTTPTVAPAGAEALIRAAWGSSKHAGTFVIDGRGQHNDCARCHSPLNWVPTSSADLPMQCTSCKFNVPNPKPVPKAEWKSVGCDICHRVEDGAVTAQLAWLDALIAQYESGSDPYQPVQTHTELCEKCHRDSGAEQARRDLGSAAHVGYACTDCHDAHSTKASCTAAGCHPNAAKPATPIEGHDSAHAAVSCVACHDASGLKVGPAEDKTWQPFRAAQMAGQGDTVPYVSHNLQRKVDCARCHFAGNPWSLKADKS